MTRSRQGTIIYFSGVGGQWTEADYRRAVSEFRLNERYCEVASEGDAHHTLRLLIQRGALYVEALCLGRDSDGALVEVGPPVHLYG